MEQQLQEALDKAQLAEELQEQLGGVREQVHEIGLQLHSVLERAQMAEQLQQELSDVREEL